MLIQRLITALILLFLFLGTLFAQSPLVFMAFCGVAILIAAWEWAGFAELQSVAQKVAYVAVMALACIDVAWISGAINFDGGVAKMNMQLLTKLFYFAGAFWLGVLGLLLAYPASQKIWAAKFTRLLFGVILLMSAWAAILYLRNHSHGQFWVIYIVAVVAAADVGAYFVGKAIGRRKLAPAVSPGKSWEGFIGGVLASQLFAFALAAFFADRADSPLPEMWMLLLVTALLAGVSVLGDLFESMLKRSCGLKDSGSILPGHGGVLDRIDGLTAALPIFALLSISLGW